MATAKKKPPAPAPQGGFRVNAGRKATDGVVGATQKSVNLTHGQNEFLKSLGGSVWLRGVLNLRAKRAGIDIDNFKFIPEKAD